MANVKLYFGITLLVTLLEISLLPTGIVANAADCFENNWDITSNTPIYANVTVPKQRFLLKFVTDEFLKLIEYFNSESVRILEHMLQDPVFDYHTHNSAIRKFKQKIFDFLKNALTMKTVRDQYLFLDKFSNEVDDVIRKDFKVSNARHAEAIMAKVWEEHGLMALSAELEQRLNHFFQAFNHKFEDYRRRLTESELQTKSNRVLFNWFISMKAKSSLEDIVEGFTEFFQLHNSQFI